MRLQGPQAAQSAGRGRPFTLVNSSCRMRAPATEHRQHWRPAVGRGMAMRQVGANLGELLVIPERTGIKDTVLLVVTILCLALLVARPVTAIKPLGLRCAH
jgi:hypothetical protein